MMTRLMLLAIAVAIAVVATIFYRCVNRGLSSSSKHQQLTRLSVASLIAMAPWLLIGHWICAAATAMIVAVSAAWATTYPLLYHLTNRRVSSDYDNQMDIAAGLYLFGLLSAAYIVCAATFPPLCALIGVVEFALWLLILTQWVYFALYGQAIDFNGMTILQATHVNEIFEFVKTLGFIRSAAISALILVLLAVSVLANIADPLPSLDPVLVMVEVAVAVIVAIFLFKGRKAPWKRTGLVNLYRVIKDYRERNSKYTADAATRLDSLDVRPLGTADSQPHTVVMVIGESANRDFMSAFTPLDRDTTPWLSASAASDRFILFPNAYSCAMVTVNSLERALTERNQYNDKPFHDSVSIIDMAHKLGYKVHWYSNQGHLGSFDTQVTLVADTADVAKWTNQHLNKVQYDSALIDFLDEVDPSCNNFVVVHLKGSHFPFANRYPADAALWSPAKGEDPNVVAYLNSIRYTDSVLRQIFDYAVARLNLQAMVYFSDHATIPDRTRTPGFMGFGMTRIPLFIYLSEGYSLRHPARYAALRANKDKYFTNDLAYELLCGILDVESPRFDESASLASLSYRFSCDMLLTYDGTVRIADDTTDSQ